MKKTMLFILVLTLVSAMSLSFADIENYGATGALENDTHTLDEMLIYAIQDEYTALAEYELIMSEYGTIRPFSNIAKAETNHISWLEPLFEKYDIDLPVNESDQIVVLPNSLTEAYQTGVDAEVFNISMYESFLKEDLPADVKTVFEALKNASENHLNAFNNQVDRSSRFRRNQN
ncbi:ferritin-like domain-containing protein [Fusibacter ferrireducens]|uniref:DUF2202 domain-containing protein n=1 Tax=Fusibacter ferrireducens TaxID=2785058 RepID=A0ABR9ZR06_9FIRM|nr:DUF2202 domain-containing protein [Fusibacter ferrireducens]MBF4692882.1 DUF2202 domain-containing protein [Fusibacter ferrireducens]